MKTSALQTLNGVDKYLNLFFFRFLMIRSPSLKKSNRYCIGTGDTEPLLLFDIGSKHNPSVPLVVGTGGSSSEPLIGGYI